MVTTYHKQTSLQIIALAVAQEVADYDDRQYKEYNHEDLEIEVHIFPEKPANDDDERSIEQRRLNGGTNAVKESKVL